MKKTSKCNPLIRKESKMKKYLFLAAALIAMGCGMSSCSNEVDVTEQTEQAPKLTKLVFTVAQDAETRVTWGGPRDRTPMFEDGEFVSLFSENNNNVQLTAHVDGEGNVTLTGEGTSGDANLYFVYPYDADASYDYAYDPNTINGNSIMGSTSPYNFDGSINPSVNNKYPSNAFSLATSTDGGESPITFQGLTTIIKFTPASDCTGFINIGAGDDAFPSTGVNIDLNESKIIGTLIPSISLPYEDAAYNFTAGTSYYFALPPFTMLSGGYIKFVDEEFEETPLYTASADKDFEAGKIYSLKYGSTGGEVEFTKAEFKTKFGTSSSFTIEKEGIAMAFSISPSSPRSPIPEFSIAKASGKVSFSEIQENDRMTIDVTGGTITSVTNSATSKTLEGAGPWTLTYKTSPSAGWYTSGGDAFIGEEIPSTAKLTVVYE